MSRPFPIRGVEQAFVRNAMLGVELLDAVTLERVSAGVKVDAKGLKGKPIVNASGLFVWLAENFASLERITIEPGVLPYEPVELQPGDVQVPLTRVELSPRLDYPFATGVTGLRGILVESLADDPRIPVADAVVHLRWLDENNVFVDAPSRSRTEPKGGSFTSFLRLAPNEVPLVDPAGNVTVRIRARRGNDERETADLKLPQGRIADPSIFVQGSSALIFAWDQMQ